jgi:hypothetical protein
MFSTRRSPDPVKDRAHPSSLRPSPELLRSCSTPITFRCRLHLPLGFVPSSRHHQRAATFFREASHSPLRSARRFSQPLDGFFRSSARRLISSRSHVQGSLSFRGFSPDAAVLLHQKDPASLPLLHRRSSSAPIFTGSKHRPRTMPLGFEAFIHAGQRSSGLVIHRAQSRSPHRISRSSRSRARPDNGFRSHGLHPFMMLRAGLRSRDSLFRVLALHADLRCFMAVPTCSRPRAAFRAHSCMGLAAHTFVLSSQPSHSRSSWFSILPHHHRDPTFSSSASIDPARISFDAAVGGHLSTSTYRQHRARRSSARDHPSAFTRTNIAAEDCSSV